MKTVFNVWIFFQGIIWQGVSFFNGGGAVIFFVGRASPLAMFQMILVRGITAKFFQCCFIRETHIVVAVFYIWIFFK